MNVSSTNTYTTTLTSGAPAASINLTLPEPVELDRVKRPDKASSEETPPAAPPVQSSKDNVPLRLDT